MPAINAHKYAKPKPVHGTEEGTTPCPHCGADLAGKDALWIDNDVVECKRVNQTEWYRACMLQDGTIQVRDHYDTEEYDWETESSDLLDTRIRCAQCDGYLPGYHEIDWNY